MPFFSQKKTQTQAPKELGFEPEERPTPFLGKLLLVILTVVLIFFGWRGLEDLGDIPKKPENLSTCFVRTGTSLRSQDTKSRYYSSDPSKPENFPTHIFSSGQICTFSSYEKSAGVPEVFQKAKSGYSPVENAQQKVSSLQNQISTLRSRYDTSLRERVADQQPLYQTPEQLRSQITTLEGDLNSAKFELENVKTQFFSTYIPPLIKAYEKAQDSYDRAWAGYKFQVFLLEIIFTVPFFVVSVWFYRRLHGRSSPHTVISIPLVAVASILLARVILVYFWALFLADLVEFLLTLFSGAAIFRTLIYYAGMALAFVIFGGAVFLLQRKIFAPERVRARRLRAQKCPYCETPIALSKNYCVGCGRQLLAKCSSCGQARLTDMRYCPFCGKQ